MFKKIYILSCLYFFISLVYATTLEDIKPHTPNKKPWSEQWFYYLNDPDVGYFKVSLQTYIMPDANEMKEKGYVHFVFAPKNGVMKVFDYYFDEVILYAAEKGSDSFRYYIPGYVDATDNQVTLMFPDFTFSFIYTGKHKHYWGGHNPGQTPFGFIMDLPFVEPNWFVFSMGTPSEYSYSDQSMSYSSNGTVYLDKGWYTQEGAASNFYLLGMNDLQQFMITGASIGHLTTELWAGRYLSGRLNLILYPAISGLSMKRVINECNGTLQAEFKKLTQTIRVTARADKSDFYRSDIPTIKVFNAKYPYRKSMMATIDVSVYQFGRLREHVSFPQGLLEFSGKPICEEGGIYAND
ncbi:hypothetical protein [Zooshikella harenae]|uniref:AttH domain-containing protein n=1 Tax=Zooshikella harenae TaxID=2827238 RepID=A0ABS5ZGT1_9GAMM|nr:hypothetical protein [Zooshikella harenae]MBU2713271.1 hypothetical protein [Zooshikella harenae]